MRLFRVSPDPLTSALPTTAAAARAKALRTASISVAWDASRSAARRPASSITRITPFSAFIHPTDAGVHDERRAGDRPCPTRQTMLDKDVGGMLDRVDRNRPKAM